MNPASHSRAEIRLSLALFLALLFLCAEVLALTATNGNDFAFFDLAPVVPQDAVVLTALDIPVCENFDTLASSGTSSTVPTGWAFSETGTNANTTYTAGTGSSTTGDTYSFGSAGNTDRAFGGLQNGSLNPRIGAAFTNNTAQTISAILINYTGEQWRLGTFGRVDRLDFQISTDATSLTTGTWVDVDALDFTAPVQTGTVGALDGNAAANRTVITNTIGGPSIPDGATFWIRWTDFNAAGADDGLAIDDFCLTPSASTPTPSPTPTPTPGTGLIVISQIFGGGGNSGAPYTNDFIELFNRGQTPVNVNGWSVQYTSATGGSWSATPLTDVTIQPGQYYLVQEAAGAATPAPLPTPDAIGTITMASTAGKVALVNSTTILTGTCPTDASIMDKIGYGSTANCFEGGGPAPAPSNTTADLRADNGCTDTNDNAADFSTGSPNPRNTASTTFNVCGKSTPTPTPTPAGTPTPTPAPTPTPSSTPISPCDLVIYRVGDGSGALTTNATVVFLDEYTTTGSLVQSIQMPTVVSGPNKRCTAAGNATSEGLLTTSTDGRYLLATGYDADVGTAGVSTSTSAAINRVIARVDCNGLIDTTTALTDAVSGGSPRSATSADGTDLWISGATGGIRYATLGGTTSVQLSTTVTNLRAASIFGGQLYVSSVSGTTRVATVGTGTPTTGGQTIANLPGIDNTNVTGPYGFFLADLDGGVAGDDTLYIADDGGGLLRKFSLVAGTWVSNGSVSATTPRGIIGTIDGTSVTLYVTSATSLRSLIDTTGYSGTIAGTLTQLATPPPNTAFRGVAFAPRACKIPSCPPTITQSASQTIVSGNSVSCNDGMGHHTDTSYWRAFNVANRGQQYNISSVSFGIESATAGSGAGQPVTVNLYVNNGAAFPAGTGTLLGSATVNVPNQFGTILNVPLIVSVTGGTLQLVMEVFTPDGRTAGNSFRIGSNSAGQTGPSYISAAYCGVKTPTDLAALGFPNMHIVMNVNGICPSPTPTPTPTPAVPTSAVSRKTHDGGGTFEIDLPLTGTPGIECRIGGLTDDYTVVITFTGNVTVTGSPQVQVTSGTATIGTGGVSNGGMVTVSGNIVTVPLTNVADAQTISVTLFGINGASNVAIPMSILVGDVNGNGAVNAGDIVATKSRIGQPVDATNFRADMNASGAINATDVSIVKSYTGTGLP